MDNHKKLRSVRRASGAVEKMTYEAVCEELGFIASVNFVKITNAGTISFTCGKRNEVCALLNAVEAHGFVPSKNLADAAHGVS